MPVTPFMQQYLAIKERVPDCLVFFRLGDFYEMFYEDAETGSRELELTLTARAAGKDEKAPMCGVPYHAAETYIYRLIQKGYRVAICDQLEDPKATKGLVKRDIVKIVTPGTILYENAIAAKSNNYLAYIVEGNGNLALLLADISTGECAYGTWDSKKESDGFLDMLSVHNPAEAVLDVSDDMYLKIESYAAARLGGCLLERRSTEEETAPLPDIADEIKDETVRRAMRGLSGYLTEVMRGNVASVRTLRSLREDRVMLLSEETLRNLEITRNMWDGGRRGTLLEILDYTETPMGARLLRRWLERPLTDINAITLRQDAIEELCAHTTELSKLQKLLSRIFDFERILTRIEANTTSPKDLLSLKASLAILPDLKQLLGGASSLLLQKLTGNIHLHEAVFHLLDSAMDENGTGNVKDGHYIKAGYNAELDELRAITEDSRRFIAELEEKEKEKTGIKLKIGFNNVFGYYFEISHANKLPIPEYYIRKQTLANAERYITPELKEFEIKALTAKEKTEQLEMRLYQEVKAELRPAVSDILSTARAIGEVDTLASLSRAAVKERLTRPRITREEGISVTEGRHPMMARALKHEMFVPNDTRLSHQDAEIHIITGPNMAGKSTYMRQVAILVLLAQTGSFIPAKSASICPVDRIFTRIGATDDILNGQSTFMVEMQEVSAILRAATKHSLIIMDEIGRGTSTYDGMSIARAVVEYLEKKIHAYTLFATHYHELAALEEASPVIKNFTVTVKERGKDITFLRRIVPGSADKSYGIHVARLAGLPESLLERAEEILENLETGSAAPQEAKPVNAPAQGYGDLFTDPIIEKLKQIDALALTPIEAINTLYKLSQEAKEAH